MKVFMKEVKVDELLFGKDLGDKIKEKKNIEKSAQNIKPINNKPKNTRGASQSLPKNFRGKMQNTGRQKTKTNPQRGQFRKHVESASPQTSRKVPVPHSRPHYSSRK